MVGGWLGYQWADFHCDFQVTPSQFVKIERNASLTSRGSHQSRKDNGGGRVKTSNVIFHIIGKKLSNPSSKKEMHRKFSYICHYFHSSGGGIEARNGNSFLLCWLLLMTTISDDISV